MTISKIRQFVHLMGRLLISLGARLYDMAFNTHSCLHFSTKQLIFPLKVQMNYITYLLYNIVSESKLGFLLHCLLKVLFSPNIPKIPTFEQKKCLPRFKMSLLRTRGNHCLSWFTMIGNVDFKPWVNLRSQNMYPGQDPWGERGGCQGIVISRIRGSLTFFGSPKASFLGYMSPEA